MNTKTRTQVAGMLALMVDNAFSRADVTGVGADLAVLEAATRGMARLGLSVEGEWSGVRKCRHVCVGVFGGRGLNVSVGVGWGVWV